MMCVCHRCQRLAAAMDDDILAHVDEDVADLMELAFGVARSHGAAGIGFEHVLHAMTSLRTGCAWLAHVGIDIAWLRQEAASVMAETGHLIADSRGTSRHIPSIEEDVATALELAAEDARAGSGYAGLGNLLAVLMAYEPGEQALVGLFGALRGGAIAGGQSNVREAGTGGAAIAMHGAMEAGRAPASFGFHAVHEAAKVNAALDTSVAQRSLEARLAVVEARGAEDRQRIEQALAELSRQREQLPAAEDWRSQMQALVTQIDAMRRRPADATLDRERDRRLTELVGILERQARDLERLSQTVARLERLTSHAQAASTVVPAGGDREGVRPKAETPARETERAIPGWGSGALATAVAASAAAMLVARTGKESTSEAVTKKQERTPAASNTPEVRREQELSQASAQATPARARTGRRLTRTANARARRRTGRRFQRLALAHVARLELRGRPKRRERSWWRWLSDRQRWRAARQRGGRFRSFGERFNHRGRAASGSWDRTRRAHDRGMDNTNPGKRFYLSMDDDIVDGPSIGPKTAERLRPARIFTVRDLLNADAEHVAGVVTARHITAQAVRDWQDQARLVITVPFLRGTHAQLLVGAGFRNYEDVALADQATLMSALLKFATTREGQGILRNGPPPDLEKVVKWMEHALESEPARAA